MESKKIKEKRIIFREGDQEPFMYHIVYGTVGIFQNYGTSHEKKLAEIREGFFGEMGMIEGKPRNATAVALEETGLSVITEDKLEEYFREYPAKIVVLLQNISSRIRKTNNDYMDICRKISQYEAGNGAEAETESRSREKTGDRERGNEEAGLKTFPAGTVICHEGVYEPWIYELVHGSVGVYKDYGLKTEKKLAVITDGYFGEMGLIEAAPRSATMIAEEDTEAMLIDSEIFSRYFSEHPDKIRKFLQLLSMRLRKVDEEYREAYACWKKLQRPEEKDSSFRNAVKKFSSIFRMRG